MADFLRTAIAVARGQRRAVAAGSDAAWFAHRAELVETYRELRELRGEKEFNETITEAALSEDTLALLTAAGVIGQ
jgi:hypothetical protein